MSVSVRIVLSAKLKLVSNPSSKNHLCAEKNRPICAGSCASVSARKSVQRKFFYLCLCVCVCVEAAKCFNKIQALCLFIFGSWIWHTISVQTHTYASAQQFTNGMNTLFSTLRSVFYILLNVICHVCGRLL